MVDAEAEELQGLRRNLDRPPEDSSELLTVAEGRGRGNGRKKLNCCCQNKVVG